LGTFPFRQRLLLYHEACPIASDKQRCICHFLQLRTAFP